MAPTLTPTRVHQFLSKLTVRSADADPDDFSNGPLAARVVLLARATTTTDPSSGTTDPTHINNKGMFALFGLLGVAICLAMVWFFFWAKNGGFHFGNNDWDDYKSTVLRRRGPNGTLLSNATPSTNLGGGSVYKDVDDYTEDSTTVVTASSGTTEMSGITAGASDLAGREKRRKKRDQREREKEKERERRRTEKSRERKEKKEQSRRMINEDGVLVDEHAEAEAKARLRDYRHEKAARVGGINRESDSSVWDGSNPSGSSAATESTVTSELIPNREVTPTSTPTKKKRGIAASGGGIRKVYSTADRNAEREKEREKDRMRRERRQQERNRAISSRRDFSWQHGEDASTHLRQIDEGSHLEEEESQAPSAFTDDVPESDLGTKSYRHYIPGLSSVASETESQDFAYEDKRKERQRRSGFRR